jgi:hypothetical protein
VPEQDGNGTNAFDNILEGAVSRVPRRSLGARARPVATGSLAGAPAVVRARAVASAGRPDLDRDDLNGVQAQAAALVGRCFGNRPGPFLQVVVHDDGARGQGQPRRLEGNGCRERQGVSSTTAGNEHQSTRTGRADLPESFSNGQPGGRDGAMRSAH